MSRELVAVGDVESLIFEVFLDELPATGLTDIQVRALEAPDGAPACHRVDVAQYSGMQAGFPRR